MCESELDHIDCKFHLIAFTAFAPTWKLKFKVAFEFEAFNTVGYIFMEEECA